MFSLIITIIAIALVAALAVATIYYGGDILVSQKAKANAATLDAQTQQIFAASQAYYLDNNAWPANVAVLSVDGKYLKTSPVPPGSAYAALPAELVGVAYADGDGAVTGTLPELNKPTGTYLESDSALMADFRVEAADAAVLRTQLLQLNGRTDANGANLATKALQVMQREVAVQATGKPSLLDYTWPAAAAQNPRTRYLWIPSKVNKETCRAVNVQWRQSILIPDGYSATNGTVQCFGTDSTGYSYFWLSPGADPSQIVLPGQPSSGPVTDQGADARLGRHLPLVSNLGGTVVGSTRSKTVTVTNRSAEAQGYTLHFDEYSVASGDAALVDFSIENDTCTGATVSVGNTCTFTVRWTPSVVESGDLYVNLTSPQGVDEWGDVMAAGTAGPEQIYTLVFNQGQPGGGLIFTNGTTDGGSLRWGSQPESRLGDPNVVASFCATDPAAEAALGSVSTSAWYGIPATGGSVGPMGTVDGKTCFVISDQNSGPGTYSVEIVTEVGTFRSTLVVRDVGAVTDLCTNISGVQATVPAGMAEAGGVCTVAGAPSPCAANQVQVGTTCVAAPAASGTSFMTPDTIDFGAVPVNVVVTRTVSLRNESGAADVPHIQVTEDTRSPTNPAGSSFNSNVTDSGTLRNITVASSCVGQPVADGATCDVTLFFKGEYASETSVSLMAWWDTAGNYDYGTGAGRVIAQSGATPPASPTSGTMTLLEDCRGDLYSGAVCLPAGSSLADFQAMRLGDIRNQRPMHFQAVGGTNLSAGQKLTIDSADFVGWSNVPVFSVTCTTDSCYTGSYISWSGGWNAPGLEDWLSYQLHYYNVWQQPASGGWAITYQLRDGSNNIIATQTTEVGLISPAVWRGYHLTSATNYTQFPYGAPSVAIQWIEENCLNPAAPGYQFDISDTSTGSPWTSVPANLSTSDPSACYGSGGYLVKGDFPASVWAGRPNVYVKAQLPSAWRGAREGESIAAVPLVATRGGGSMVVLPGPVPQSCVQGSPFTSRGAVIRLDLQGSVNPNNGWALDDYPTTITLRNSNGDSVPVSWAPVSGNASQISVTIPADLGVGNWEFHIANRYGKTLQDWNAEMASDQREVLPVRVALNRSEVNLTMLNSYLSYNACAVPSWVNGSPSAGGADGTWGSWEAVTAFGGDSCLPGESGACEVSGASTATVCPQFEFIASGGAYDGCLRRKCVNPLHAAGYIPGC